MCKWDIDIHAAKHPHTKINKTKLKRHTICKLFLFCGLSIHENIFYVKLSNYKIFDDLEIFNSQFYHFAVVESLFLSNIMLMKLGVKPSAT